MGISGRVVNASLFEEIEEVGVGTPQKFRRKPGRTGTATKEGQNDLLPGLLLELLSECIADRVRNIQIDMQASHVRTLPESIYTKEFTTSPAQRDAVALLLRVSRWCRRIGQDTATARPSLASPAIGYLPQYLVV
jgi:hypothetical protein